MYAAHTNQLVLPPAPWIHTHTQTHSQWSNEEQTGKQNTHTHKQHATTCVCLGFFFSVCMCVRGLTSYSWQRSRNGRVKERDNDGRFDRLQYGDVRVILSRSIQFPLNTQNTL